MKIRAVIIVSALLLFGSGCTDDNSGNGEDPSRSHKIVVQVEGEREEAVVYEALVDSFEEANPDVKVDLVAVGDDDNLPKLTTAFAAGDPPDVFLINYRDYSQFVVRDAIEPLEDHLDEAGISLDEYYEPPVDAFTYNGTLECMPQNISSLVVYYNTDLFKQAKIGHPQTWSWEEFRTDAIKLTHDDQRGLGIDPRIIRVAPFIWSAGGDLVDDVESPTHFTLDTPEARHALEYLVGLVRKDKVVPTEAEVSAQDLESRFAAGKVAMYLASRRNTPEFREVSGLNFDVAPLPTDQERAGILHSDGYCIAAGSEETEAAARFIGYALGEEGQTVTSLAGRTVPSLEKVATSGAFLNPTESPSHNEVFLDVIPYIQRVPVVPTWAEIESLTDEFLTRLFYEDGYTIDQFISDATTETEPLFEEAASG
jgi:multiple sugar transport system substrate-binding protein